MWDARDMVHKWVGLCCDAHHIHYSRIQEIKVGFWFHWLLKNLLKCESAL